MNREKEDGDIDLIDFVVVVVEHWLLLTIIPLVGAIAVFLLWSFGIPPRYESTAVLTMTADEAALLQSAKVLDAPLLATQRLAQDSGSLPAYRLKFQEENLTVTKFENADYYNVSVEDNTSADEVRTLLSEIVKSLIANSTPTPTTREALELRREQISVSIDEMQETLGRLNRLADRSLESTNVSTDLSLGEFGQSTVTILTSIESRRTELFEIEEALTGSVSQDDILQQPTLPDRPLSRGLVVNMIFAGIASGLLTLVGVFVVAIFRSAVSKPGNLSKLNRIRKAFWLPPRDTGAKTSS